MKTGCSGQLTLWKVEKQRVTVDFHGGEIVTDAGLLAARHFAQSPELYASIQMSNPATREVTDAFIAAAREFQEVTSAGDTAKFAALFDEVRSYFGGFTTRAVEQSDFLIDRLVERT